MAWWIKGLLHRRGGGRTRVQIARAHVKANVTVHICNPRSTPAEKREVEAGVSLEALRLPGLA